MLDEIETAPPGLPPLAFPFVSRRYDHALVRRTGLVCLVARTNLVTGNTHWEVVRLRENRAWVAPNGVTIPPGESYPISTSWGQNGWTCTTLEEAERKYGLLT